jgi:lipid-binding SYLF domain-containing protein
VAGGDKRQRYLIPGASGTIGPKPNCPGTARRCTPGERLTQINAFAYPFGYDEGFAWSFSNLRRWKRAANRKGALVMSTYRGILHVIFAIALSVFTLGHAAAASLDQDANAALQSLYSTSPGAKAIGAKAKGILVFPKITKAGLVVGGQGGDGTLFENGKPTAHYSTGAASVGLQAGVQTYGYALFFITDEDLNYLKTSSGWSLGTGPNIVIADAGAAKDASTLTGKKGVYAFIFDQKGLMAGLGLVGQKITKLDK